MVASIAGAGAAAQSSYHDKPVRLVIGFPTGSATDLASRILARKMSELLGQRVVVDNRPGASTSIAAVVVAPARTPEAVIHKLAGAVNRSLDSQDVKDQLAAQGIEPFKGDAKRFSEHMQREMTRWAALIKSLGITADRGGRPGHTAGHTPGHTDRNTP